MSDFTNFSDDVSDTKREHPYFFWGTAALLFTLTVLVIRKCYRACFVRAAQHQPPPDTFDASAFASELQRIQAMHALEEAMGTGSPTSSSMSPQMLADMNHGQPAMATPGMIDVAASEAGWLSSVNSVLRGLGLMSGSDTLALPLALPAEETRASTPPTGMVSMPVASPAYTGSPTLSLTAASADAESVPTLDSDNPYAWQLVASSDDGSSPASLSPRVPQGSPTSTPPLGPTPSTSGEASSTNDTPGFLPALIEGLDRLRQGINVGLTGLIDSLRGAETLPTPAPARDRNNLFTPGEFATAPPIPPTITVQDAAGPLGGSPPTGHRSTAIRRKTPDSSPKDVSGQPLPAAGSGSPR